MPQYTPEDLAAAGLTKEELDAINGDEHDADALAELAGGDNDEDDEDDEGDASTGKENDDTPSDQDDQTAAGDGTAQPEPDDEDEDDDAPVVYRAAPVANAEARLKAADEKEEDAFSKLMDGDITADEYQTAKREAQAERNAVNEAQLKATIANEMNQQASQASWDRSCERFLAVTKKNEGIDYTGNVLLGQAFDSAVRALAADPKHADKPASFFLGEAHKQVKAAFGHAPAATPAAAPAASPAAKRPPVDRSAIPPGLAGLPPAQEAVVGEDEFAHLRNLKGNDYERAIAAMSQAQLDRFMAS